MIAVWTLIVVFYASDSSTKHEAIFLSKEECTRVGNIIKKTNLGLRIETFCYESTRIDTK
jgi:hypothetical protein